VTHQELRLTDEYHNMRGTFTSFWEAEEALGRELTEAEELAIYDNKDDENISLMGR